MGFTLVYCRRNLKAKSLIIPFIIDRFILIILERNIQYNQNSNTYQEQN